MFVLMENSKVNSKTTTFIYMGLFNYNPSPPPLNPKSRIILPQNLESFFIFRANPKSHGKK